MPDPTPGPPGSPVDDTIDVHVVPDMPPLAWLVRIAAPRPTLLCGADVEFFGDSFFEGCWAGDFERRDFDTARHVFGSGGRIDANRALFVTPSHTLDALYVLGRGGAFFVANSLALLVQFTGVELPFDFNIGARFVSVRKGIEAYERIIFKQPDWALYRFVYDNIEIRGGEIRTLAKLPRQEAAFDNYTSYRDFLLSTLRRLVSNASSDGRKVRYPLITSCSSGYDSTACAALAAQLGCRQAVTLRTARGGHADSGRGVAEALGLEVVELDRPDRASGTAYEEAEFLATGVGGEDYVFNGFGQHCHHKILLTGFHGGAIWNRHASQPEHLLQRKDVSGSSLTEFRLRYGFIQVPLAFVGAAWPDVLIKFSNSVEMGPYQVGGDYDRPIPRRIAEEQGVPRGTFGTAKKAGSINFGYLSIFWSPHTLQDLRRFERRVLARKRGMAPYYYTYATTRTATLLGLYGMRRLAGQLGLGHLRDRLWNRYASTLDTLGCNHPRYSNMAFLWAVDKVRSRYPSGIPGRSPDCTEQ